MPGRTGATTCTTLLRSYSVSGPATAKAKVPGTDGLLLRAEAAVYLALGRLDKIPLQKLSEFCRPGGDPTCLAILRMMAGQTDDAMKLLQVGLERRPLDNPSRMFMAEMLRTKGDTARAVHLLERTLQQGSRHMTPAFYLALAYLDAGKRDSARDLLLRMRPEFEKNFLWRHAWAILLAAEGKHDQASEFMDEENLRFARFAWTAWSPTADYYATFDFSSCFMLWSYDRQLQELPSNDCLRLKPRLSER